MSDFIAQLESVAAEAKAENPGLPDSTIYTAMLGLLSPDDRATLSLELSKREILRELENAARSSGEGKDLAVRLNRALVEQKEMEEARNRWSDRVFELDAARKQLMSRNVENKAKLPDALGTEIEAQLAAVKGTTNRKFRIMPFDKVAAIESEIKNATRTTEVLQNQLIPEAREKERLYQKQVSLAESVAAFAAADFLDFVTQERVASASLLQGGRLKVDTSAGQSGAWREAGKKALWNYNQLANITERR